jgi:hypothetical protein
MISTPAARLSRKDVAQLLNIKYAGVVRLEERKLLRPCHVEPTGARLYARKDVQSLQARIEAGEIDLGEPGPRRAPSTSVVPEPTADQVRAAFGMFRAKKTLPDVVEQTGLLPDQVRELYAQYRAPLDVPAAAIDGGRASRTSKRATRAEQNDAEQRAYQRRMEEFEREERARRDREDEQARQRHRRLDEELRQAEQTFDATMASVRAQRQLLRERAARRAQGLCNDDEVESHV